MSTSKTHERNFILRVVFDPSSKMPPETMTVEGADALQKTVESYQRDTRTVRLDVYERSNSLVRTVSWTDTQNSTTTNANPRS